MLTYYKLVLPQLSKLRRFVCNVMEVKQELEMDKTKVLKDSRGGKRHNTIHMQLKNISVKDMMDNKTSEKIVQQVHQKLIRSIVPSMIQDLQPMNMPSYGMKHNASCPESRHAYLKVANSLSKARLEENGELVLKADKN